MRNHGHRALVAAVAVLALAAADALAGRPPGVVAVHGDKISAQIEAGDTDSFAVDLGAGGSLGVTAKAKAPLLPVVRVFDPSGAEVDVSALTKGAGRTTVKVKGMAAAPGQTGTWRVVVEGGGTTGNYTASFAVKQPSSVKRKATLVPAGATTDVVFAASGGAVVTIAVTEKLGGPLDSVRLLDAQGNEIAGPASFARKKNKLTLAATALPAGTPIGDLTLRLGAGAAGVTADVTVGVKFAKVKKRKATLAPEAAFTALDPGIVRQEDAGVPATATGANLLAGTQFEFDDPAVVAGVAAIEGTTTARFGVSVAEDAPIGEHELWAYPPPLLGEPVFAGTIIVYAPGPQVTSVSIASAKQRDSNVLLEVSGARFRAGGAIAVSGEGVTAGPTTVVSPTLARTRITVADDAALGPREVSFTQAAAAGGAQGSLPAALSVHAPDPSLTGVSAALIRQEDAGVRVTLTGDAFRDGGTVSVSGPGITVANATRLSDTSFQVDLSAASDAAFGARDISYAQPAIGGGASVTLPGAIAVRAPIPTTSGVSPAELRQGATGTSLTLSGTGFRAGGSIALSGTGLAVGATSIVSPTQATVSIDTDAAATFGARDVVYTQPVAGGGDAVMLTGAVTVKAPVPTVTGASPSFVRQGAAAQTITLTGTGFRTGGSVSIAGSGLHLGPLVVVNATTATLDVNADADAAFGARDVVFTQPLVGGGDAGTLAGGLTVRAPIPTVTAVFPTSLRQGDLDVLVTLTGTGFRSGGAISASGSGVSFGAAIVLSDTTATALATVTADAAFGARGVTFTQPAGGGGDAGTLAASLTIRAPLPSISLVSPGVLRQGDTSQPLTITGAGFRSGGAITISGTGLTLGSTSVVNDTTANVTVTVASNAAVGVRDVTFTQPAAGGGDATTSTGSLSIHHPDPTVTALTPGIAVQGTDVSFTLTGTDFRDGATVSFGADVTVTSYTRDSDTSATVAASIGDAAAFGLRSVTYLQPAAGGGASASLTNAVRIDAPTPTVTSVSPTSLRQGQSNQTLTVNGANFRSGGAVTISGTGLTLGSTTFVSTTQVTIPVTVADDATAGARSVTFTQPAAGGGAAGTGTNLLSVHYPNPTITTVSPTQIGRTTSGTLTVTGTGFRSGFTLTTPASGVTLTGSTLDSDTQVRVSFSVSGSATLGSQNLTYTQAAAGGGAAVTKTGAFEVLPPPPTVTAISPSALTVGSANFLVRVTGTGFVAGTTATASGSGVTLTNLSSGSPSTEMTLRVSVASNASVGARNVTITPGSTGGPAATFTGLVSVVPADPVVTGFSHPALAQGASGVSVTVTGADFRSGDTLAASGSGVSFTSVSVTSTSQITATASVNASAATGARSITVTRSSGDGGRSGTLANAFTVTTATPSVTAINPGTIAVTASGGPTREVPVTVTGTNFMSGASLTISRTGGSGVSVVAGTTAVVSPTSLTAVLSVTPSATTGTWNVVVTNPGSLGNSGTSGNNKLTVVSATTLAVNRVLSSSGSAHGGEKVTIHGGGFSTDAVVDFGSVRAWGTQVLDGNTLVTTVPQPASASATSSTVVSVTVTPSGSASGATLTSAYAYAADGVKFQVQATWPAQGATGVAQNVTRVAALLSSPCDTSSAPHVTSGLSNSANPYWSVGGLLTSTARGFGPLNRWLVLSRTSTSAFTSSSTSVLNVPGALTSVGGTPLAPVRFGAAGGVDQYTSTIGSTSDSTAPTLSSITPSNSATGVARMASVVLVFSEEVDPLTITSTNVSLSAGGSALGATVELASDLKTVTLRPHMRLAANTTITTTIGAGVTDMCGNAFSSVTRTFTTGSSDTSAPTIDSVAIERLPSSVDGSGTYVNSSGTGGNAFDVFLPRSEFLLDVRFADADSGIDPTTFSAKCSQAVGSTSANSELASNFTVTGAGATWRIPSGTNVGNAENVTFTFQVGDYAGNTSSTTTITVDVESKDATCTGAGSNHAGVGDHDPMDARHTWVLRTDFDAYTVTFSGSGTTAGATTTVAADNASDFEQALRLVGLGTGSMTSAASTTVNGTSVGTNAIMSRLAAERIRELLQARYGIGEDGSRGPDAVNIEFLLAGEQGSLSSLPTYSTSNSPNKSSGTFSEMTIGGTLGAESGATTASSTLGQAWYDSRNLLHEANLNTGVTSPTNQTTGVYLLGMFKRQAASASTTSWRERLLNKFVSGSTGGTPVGESSDDDDVLAGTFSRSSGSNTSAQNARYDAIMDGIEVVALYASAVLAHEVGHSVGLVGDGPPKTGLFGNAHYNNTFTEATSTNTNTSKHLDFLGADIMSASVAVESTLVTGSDFMRFNPLDLGYLLNRILFDEGR